MKGVALRTPGSARRRATVAIPRGSIACPVAAVKAWLTAAAIADRPVFRPVAKGSRVQPARLTDQALRTS
jgi:hypothetical protein